jgi:uncharacterized phage-like protein YoqJ
MNQYYNASNITPAWHNEWKLLCKAVVEHNRKFEVNKFITGMAIGFDTMVADCIIAYRDAKILDITLTAALPFPSQPSKWPQASVARWQSILKQCDEVVTVSPDPYSPAKMQIRNKWMVDNSDYVIALWHGKQQGGTWNCMAYAYSRQKMVYTLNDGWTTEPPPE